MVKKDKEVVGVSLAEGTNGVRWKFGFPERYEENYLHLIKVGDLNEERFANFIIQEIKK